MTFHLWIRQDEGIRHNDEDMGGLPPGADVGPDGQKKTISGLFSLPKTTQIQEKYNVRDWFTKQK